jgi:acyl transferase domain-containing protein/phosphopantetheinyl transferase
MACVFPQAPDLRTFWNNILGRVDAVGEPLPNWDAARYLESGRIKTAAGGYLKDLYQFDPREFGIMPNSMDGGEPDQYLALRVARDALADAGYFGPQHDHRDTGIILGHSTYLHRGQATLIQNHIVVDQTLALFGAAMPQLDRAALDELRRTLLSKLPPSNADTAPGLVPNVMTGRIANRLNLRGPNYLVDAACSSSLLAVNAAMDELRLGRSRMMLAGGVNASLPAEVTVIFTQLGALSSRGKVRPFESGSDGTLLGEGLGVVALKRLADALADGDRVYAVLRGIGQASDGRGTGLLAPSVDGETLAIRRAYEVSGVDPAGISLIEAHGTGIALGDQTEVSALKSVFGDRTTPQGSIALGSVKSMISHCIPAAGVAGLIKTALALHHRVLPPTLCEEVNPELGITTSRLFINTAAAPWMSPPETPRRAGVDSFGFGGINAHAILEQAPAQAKRPPRLSRWPCELFLLSAADAGELAVAGERLLSSLEAQPALPIAEIAAALCTADRALPARLAIVAGTPGALAKSLRAATAKLRSDGQADSWSLRSGVFYSSRALTGKLAFVFPGEGSQYLGNLADVAMCFDGAQHWLDFWRGLYPDAPGATRTDIAFPPESELTPERRRLLEARMRDMDVGSEAVMVANQALFAVLQSLGIQADAMLGHSTGESTALIASGALPAADMAQLADTVRRLNAIFMRVLAEGRIPTGALLAVGALPTQIIHERLREAGLEVQIAMDNCANQLVLYADRATIDKVAQCLGASGGICLPLPFDRGYHTPAFAAASTEFLKFYDEMQLGAPVVPLYSCASAALFPAQPAAARELAAAQWSTTVRFRETVLAMVDDGVECFVEVGPSANLTAFIGDTLADRPHLALATNQRRRGGLDQLLQTLAQLYVRRRFEAPQALFADRAIDPVQLGVAIVPVRSVPTLDNTMPVVRLDAADRARLWRLMGDERVAAVASAPAVDAQVRAAPAEPEALPPAEDPRGAVMRDYFDVMRGFLDQQRSVFETWQQAAPSHSAERAETVLAPLLAEVLEHDHAQLRAVCRLNVADLAFLRDHVLSGPVSADDPGALGLACVPFTVSLEILAEGCALLAERSDVAVIENVRAFEWLALDDGTLDLEVLVSRVDAAPAQRFRAELRKGDVVALSAEFAFGDAVWQLPALPPLAAAQPSRWGPLEIYDVGMFHGPLFRSLGQTLGWDAGGIDAELTACGLEGFLGGRQRAPLVLNPVMLDALGQLAACWYAEQIGLEFNCFPSTLNRIELYQPGPAAGLGRTLRARQSAQAGAAADLESSRSWAFELIDADGRPLMRAGGLENVFFRVPSGYCQLRTDPLTGWLGAPLEGPGSAALWRLEHLSEAFCGQSGGIFLRILAHATLAADELAEWRRLSAPLRQRRQWLLGRLCLKEAVRHWLAQQFGELVYPAEVRVWHDAAGAPFVDGWWADVVAAAPRVSLTHDADASIAAVAAGIDPVGVDAERIGRVGSPALLEAALTVDERTWLRAAGVTARDEALVRLWCAKEAAAKRMGTGLQGRPEAFEVRFNDVMGDRAQVQRGEVLVEVALRRLGDIIVAVAENETTTTRISG